MMIKLTSALFLLGALFSPLQAIAKDTSTDTAGQYVDDATITTKVKAVSAVHNNLSVTPR
jgi:hyperosmotically inducible protein